MSLLTRLQNQNPEQPITNVAAPVRELPVNRFQNLVYKIHRQVIKEIDSDNFNLQNKNEADKKKDKEDIKIIAETLLENEPEYLSRSDKEDIINQVLDEVFDFGPITPLLKDESISEVMVNGPQQVYIERKGKLEKTRVVFRDNEHLYNIRERLISPQGRRVDESMPMVDARLPDGSR
ncbi:MAG: ATPase, T2SS/T4P/T4SS family, partial [Syntrophomonas sp.]